MRIRVAHEHEFLDAAKRFDFETVRTLCEESPSLVNAQPSGRLSALHQAVLAAVASMVLNTDKVYLAFFEGLIGPFKGDKEINKEKLIKLNFID